MALYTSIQPATKNSRVREFLTLTAKELENSLTREFLPPSTDFHSKLPHGGVSIPTDLATKNSHAWEFFNIGLSYFLKTTSWGGFLQQTPALIYTQTRNSPRRLINLPQNIRRFLLGLMRCGASYRKSKQMQLMLREPSLLGVIN